MSLPSAPRAPAIAGFYFLYFATVGITLPFFPPYFKSLGFSATEVGVLLALSPLLTLVSPPLFGHLADRTGRADRVLALVAFGALAGFAPLLGARSYGAVFLCFAVSSFFVSSTTSLADSLALRRVASAGGSYAHLRVFGSLGFVASSAAFGFLASQIDRRAVIAAVACAAAGAAWSLCLRSRSAAEGRRAPFAGVRLLRDRDVVLLLAASSLHWIACAPYNGLFAIHVTALGLSPSVVAMAADAGVAAEIAVMASYPKLFERIAPRKVLFVAFAGTVVRWAGLALTSSPAAIVALSALHGLTFGAFYVAAVGFMARRVPGSLRASGQALFAAVVFGIGGLVGFPLAGAGYDLLGGHRLFGAAAALEIAAALLVVRLRAAEEPRIAEAAPASGA